MYNTFFFAVKSAIMSEVKGAVLSAVSVDLPVVVHMVSYTTCTTKLPKAMYHVPVSVSRLEVTSCCQATSCLAAAARPRGP